MRVHPTAVHSANNKWHFPAAIALLVLVLLSNFYKGSRNSANAAGEMKLATVVVAKAPIQQGKPIPKEALALENRPISMIPADSATSIDQVAGKYASGPILQGYTIAQPLLNDSKKAAEAREKESQPPPVDPITLKLAPIIKDTIGLSLPFPLGTPPRGARIAIAIQGKTGISQIVASDAWVEAITDKQNVTVRVPHPTALYLQDVKPLGTFTFFIIPEEGPSPFATEVVQDVIKLRERITGEERKERPLPPRQAVSNDDSNKKRASDFSSYAWINGQGIKYSIDKKGKLYVIDATGSVTPLYEYGLPKAPADESSAAAASGIASLAPAESSSDGEGERRPLGEVRTGLEPLYPYAPINPDEIERQKQREE